MASVADRPKEVVSVSSGPDTEKVGLPVFVMVSLSAWINAEEADTDILQESFRYVHEHAWRSFIAAGHTVSDITFLVRMGTKGNLHLGQNDVIVRSNTDWSNWQTHAEGHIPKTKPIVLVFVHDDLSAQNNSSSSDVIKNKNVVAVHTLQYHQISRRADSTDYHREMRDVYSQRPLGFYERISKEISKPMLVAGLKTNEASPGTTSEPRKTETILPATGTVTSRLLLIIDMKAWQDSRFNEKTARRSVESVLAEVYFTLGRLGHHTDRRLIFIRLENKDEKVVSLVEDMEGVQVVGTGLVIEDPRSGVVSAMKTQLLQGQKITLVLATDNRSDDNLIPVGPIVGYKHLVAAIALCWADKPRWRLETVDIDFLDHLDAKSLENYHTNSVVLSDVYQTSDCNTTSGGPGNETNIPSSITDMESSTSFDESLIDSHEHPTSGSTATSSVVTLQKHIVNSHEAREWQAFTVSTSTSDNSPTPLAPLMYPVESKASTVGSGSKKTISKIQAPSQADFTFVSNTPLPKLPVATVAKTVVKGSAPKAAPTKKSAKTQAANDPGRVFIPLVRAIRQAGLPMTPAGRRQIDRFDVGVALTKLTSWPIGDFGKLKSYIKAAAAKGYVTTGSKSNKGWVASSGQLEAHFQIPEKQNRTTGWPEYRP